MFQRAEGCAVLLLLNAIGRGKERAPAVSLSLWPYPLNPSPKNTTAPTPILATSNRKGLVISHNNVSPRGYRKSRSLQVIGRRRGK